MNKLQKLTVPVLKSLLREQGLKVGGRKAELITRILDAGLEGKVSPSEQKNSKRRSSSQAGNAPKRARTSSSSFSSLESKNANVNEHVGMIESLVEPGWKQALKSEFKADYFREIENFVSSERRSFPVYPPQHEVFSFLNLTPLDKVKVVIIGQDPYFNPDQAHGLCFSVKKGIKVPPSLNRIYHELNDDPKIPGWRRPTHGFLESWAMNGCLMLNATLTVRHRKANSHAKCGWQQFTDRIIEIVNEQLEGVVFLLWGKFAQKKANFVDRERHHVLECPHPSPMAGMGWKNNGHFSAANELLEQQGKTPVDWSIPK